MQKLRILIVDDHSVVRKGLVFILENQDEFDFEIQEASNKTACFERLKKSDFDIILLDINLGKESGIDIAKEILIYNQDQKIIALTMHEDEFIIKQMMNAGAKGYLLKNTGGEELIWAIKSVMSGEIYYSNKVAITLLNERKEKAATKTDILKESLTKREIQVLKLIVDELTNEEISQELNLSKRTVDGHRQNLLSKLNVKNTVGLVKFAIEAKIN